MTAFETELTARFAALADRSDDARWADVIARARALRRRRRAPLALAAAVLLAALLAAPAVALRGRLVHLFATAEPAPQRVERSFADLSDGRTGHAVKVLQTTDRPGSTAVLWLAPIRGGGFCTKLELAGLGGAGAECTALRPDKLLNVGVGLDGLTSPEGRVVTGPVLLDGRTSDPRADSLVLRFQDGGSTHIQLVWVTEPVATGFFVYSLPERHWHAGHLPTTLTLYASDGDELDRRDVHGIPAG
jgi:hypothetical protein